MTVRGLVQGVGFRYYARASAQRFGVAGWVCNAEDGSVEIWAEGTDDRLKQFMQAIHRGPSHSQVREVDVAWKPALGTFGSFHIRY